MPQPKKMTKLCPEVAFIRIVLFFIHFCHYLWLEYLYWILVFSSHLVRARHNFWYPYCLYLWEKNISWTKGGPFDFNGHPNASATLQTWPIWLKFFLVCHVDPYNGKMWLANLILNFVVFWTPLIKKQGNLKILTK